jgi:SAM-dependent methyltransferase
MGSGSESFYKKIFKKFPGIIRVGIPHNGKVNVYGDAMSLPLKNDSVDLFISSSVIEHLPNPEKSVSELFRTIKPGGSVYVEIPFLAAYHMAPHDYQRYTISGIESLFSRHGFKMLDKGVCSGPINAIILIFQHAIIESITWGPLQYFLRLILTYFLHPFKYLDFIIGQSRWSKYLACNFFYSGRKPK